MSASSPPTVVVAADCWGSGYTYGNCCSALYGRSGNPSCWAPPELTFDRCCVGGVSRSVFVDSSPINAYGTRSMSWAIVAPRAIEYVRKGLEDISFDYLHFVIENAERVRQVQLCAGNQSTSKRCERYTLSDGLCVLEVDGPRREFALVRSTCNPPLWLCTLSAPLALLLLPKAASTSLANWAGRIDGLHGRWSALREAVVGGGHARVAELLHGRFVNRSRYEVESLVERARAARSSFIAPSKHRRTAVFTDLRERSGAFDVVPPAIDCPTCCSSPAPWRTRVAVARHPLARLVSYFGMAWAGNTDRGNFSSWCRFSEWLLHVCGKAVSREAASYFTSVDEYHTRPVAAWIRQRVTLDAREEITKAGIFTVRIEHLNSDLQRLEAALCERHAFCKHLPRLLRRRLEATTLAEAAARPDRSMRLQGYGKRREKPSWMRLWADDSLRAAVLERYQDDFRLLGYGAGLEDLLTI